MQNSTSSVKQTLSDTNPIANRIKTNTLNPIANSQLDSTTVDFLLQDYSDLIDPGYTKWFAKRFYTLGFDQIHRAASEARQDGRDSKRLFAHLIKKL